MTSMFALPLNVFRKSAICPSSRDLLTFADSKLDVARESLIEAHLRDCDFCRAELHLLERHRPQPELTAATEIPLSLRQLAEFVLQEDRRSRLWHHTREN